MIRLENGDCLDVMPTIENKSIDLILCDLPYGTTANTWDKKIPLGDLWNEYERIIKDDGTIVLFAKEPFTSELIMSNLSLFRYRLIWQKDRVSGFLNSSYKPLTLTEDIIIFSKATIGSNSKNPIRYYPQGVIEINKTMKNNPNSTWRKCHGYSARTNKLNSSEEYVQRFTNHPTEILKFSKDKNNFHTAQKPVALCEYLIRTYTKEGDTVMDNCMGVGSTGVASVTLKRNYIGIEISENYFQKAMKRIGEVKVI